MDAGCEYYGYVSEVTRTWSPSGKLSNAQVIFYQPQLLFYHAASCMLEHFDQQYLQGNSI